MTTKKSRLNITLPDDVRDAITMLAEREHIPAATKAGRLLEVALELEEDLAWDKIASQRDTPKAKFINHSEAFKV